MFSKSDASSAPQTGSLQGGASDGRATRLAQDLTITGNLKAAGTVEVLGKIDGDIEAGKLVIGTDGRVNGKVRAEIVDILGHLDGSVSCRSLTLRSTALAKAQVSYESLTIENGAQIEGKFKYAGAK
ncbi:bactofilin family protein [Acidimangrovimonas sediminis]|uniref:bactofilin family protein n=1 Tax=Acidimangrovimonas sediminis TaxID=2056283 RepID=UPI000C80D53E|nr:polymer-forming cytoskeletal protein [Acidimangrovimonas sediminis]